MRMDFLQQKLDERLKNGNLRTLDSKRGLLDFVSNDYLALATNRELSTQIINRVDKENVSNGGTGSRLLSGNHPYYEELEESLKKTFEAESTLVFNSGYAANQALVSSVAEKGDTILYDQLSHVCLKEGAWLSRAESTSFLHNDLDDLRSRIQRATGKVFIVTETVFSMDGDVAPLAAMVDLCEELGAYLIVDEAHSTGCYGSEGAGMLVEENLHQRVFARVYTFGKAMGVHGACIAGSKVLTDYLVNFGRPFIYTTSLPPHSVISIYESFRYLKNHINLQQQLQERIALFKKQWPSALSNTAIQPVLIGSNQQARDISDKLQGAGYDVRPILSPTVRRGTERLRISLHVHNTPDEICQLALQLGELLGERG